MAQQRQADAANLALAAAALAAYQRSVADVRTKVSDAIEAAWRSLGAWRKDQIREFLSKVLPVVQAAEQQVAAQTAAYLAAMQLATIGVPVKPTPLDLSRLTGPATRNGTTPAEVYERPFHLVWRELAKGTLLDDAVQQGMEAAQKSAMTDLQRTKTLTGQAQREESPYITGYRRVLEGERSCGLCIVASTQRYSREQLMDIHPGCDCSEAPLYGERAHVIDLPRLQDVHAAIEATFGKSSAAARTIPGAYADGKPINYRDVLITHEHGELGPVLAVRGQHFTGPSDLH